MVLLSVTVDLPLTERWATTAVLLVVQAVHLATLVVHLATRVVPLTLVQEHHLPAPPQARLDQQELPTQGLPQIFRSCKIPSTPWRSEVCKGIQDTAKLAPYPNL